MVFHVIVIVFDYWISEWFIGSFVMQDVAINILKHLKNLFGALVYRI